MLEYLLNKNSIWWWSINKYGLGGLVSIVYRLACSCCHYIIYINNVLVNLVNC